MDSIDSWLAELQSLGVTSTKEKNYTNGSKKELQDLTNDIKQTLYQEYKVAYSEV